MLCGYAQTCMQSFFLIVIKERADFNRQILTQSKSARPLIYWATPTTRRERPVRTDSGVIQLKGQADVFIKRAALVPNLNCLPTHSDNCRSKSRNICGVSSSRSGGSRPNLQGAARLLLKFTSDTLMNIILLLPLWHTSLIGQSQPVSIICSNSNRAWDHVTMCVSMSRR